MCGRYSVYAKKEMLAERFEAELMEAIEIRPSYNAAPTQHLPVVFPDEDRRRLALYRWGLIPSWSRDESIGARMINARGETLAEKPSFRAAFKSRRCLAPMNGFFEWVKTGAAKTPHYIALAKGHPFAVAGLWEEWRDKRDPRGERIIRSYTVVTTEPNEFMASIHNRMPLILHPDEEEVWLNPHSATEDLTALIHREFPSELLKSHMVSTRVNSARSNDPELIAPLDTLF